MLLRDRLGLLASYAKMIATKGRWVILSRTIRTRRNAPAESTSRNGRRHRRGIRFWCLSTYGEHSRWSKAH